MKTLQLAFVLFIAFSHFAFADAKTDDSELEKRKAAVKKLVEGLKPKQGKIEIHSGLATVNVSPKFKFLESKDADTVVVKLWGNPPGNKAIGLLYPASGGLFGTNSWAVIFHYEEDGHVKDDDANSIDYQKMLVEMKEGAQQANKERVKEGYPAVDIIGWAAPPRYDSATHKLYWAKELKFGDSEENTLNYNLRMLGRKGVLILNVVAPMSQLGDVEAAAPEILSMVDFNAGERYADFKPGTDKMATYGIAALVAGGVAAKMGLFKGLLIALLAAKKFIVIAFIAIGGFIKKLFSGRRSNDG